MPCGDPGVTQFFSSGTHIPFKESVMRNQIVGTTMPVLEFTLNPSYSIISDAGQLSWMGSLIKLTTSNHLAGEVGIFGGRGLVLQGVSGQGTGWIGVSGELIVKDLQAGELLRVHPGHVGAFQTSVNFEITTIPGIKNLIFGGDGIFLASLTGPGRVWLQTLPIAKLAHELMEYMPSQSGKAAQAGVVV